jgi:hypothetical protein
MLLPRLLPLVVLCLGISVCASARAAGGEKLPAGYKEAISHAVAELEAGNFPEAREEFRRAHGIFPNARTLRGLGTVEFELRNYAECVRLLQEALASTVKPLDGSLRAEAEALLKRAQRYLGAVRLVLEPSSAKVVVDGTPVELGPEGILLLEVGSHTLEAKAVGHSPERRVVQVEGGGRMDLTISLPLPAPPPEAGPVAAPEPDRGPPDVPPERRPAYKKWWVWTTVILVAGGGATAAALLIKRQRERDEPSVDDGANTVGVSLQTLGRY